MQTIRVITLCSGYDAQCLGLRRAHVPFDLVNWSDIDPVAIEAHNALWPEYYDRNLGDMTKIDWAAKDYGEIDLLTYSTPCTDISVAGEKQGIAEGSGTRSSIIWHTRKAIAQLRPKYLLLLENVKMLVTEKNRTYFDKWCAEVEAMGYRNYWQVLDASDFGVPQRRERVFMVSVREDIGKPFVFPAPEKQYTRCYDILDDVDLSKLEPIERETKCLNYYDTVHGYGNNFRCMEYRAYDCRAIYPCLSSSFICLVGIPKAAAINPKPFPLVDGVDRVELDPNEWAVRYPSSMEICRLMGLQRHEAEALLSVLSASQVRFVTGNSIVVNVLEHLFMNIWPNSNKKLTLF